MENFKYRLLEWLWWIFAIPVYGTAAYPSLLILHKLFPISLWLFAGFIPCACVLFIIHLLLILGALFLCTPRIQEGCYSLKRKGAVIKWMVRAGLVNYVRLIGLQRLIYSHPLLRRLYFKSFQAKVDPTAIIAYDAKLIDPYLLVIGRNVKVGEFAKISGHFANKNSFVFKKVVLEEGAIVGANGTVAPGVILKKGSMLGAESVVFPDTVIPPNEVWFGRPARRIPSP